MKAAVSKAVLLQGFLLGEPPLYTVLMALEKSWNFVFSLPCLEPLYRSLRPSVGFSEPTLHYFMSLSLIHDITFTQFRKNIVFA